jgi:hypothetical protein
MQEEASVDNQIEDFVTGATEDPTPPAAAAPAATEPVSGPAEPAQATLPDPAPAPQAATTATNAADDDKLVVDAAQKLVDSTEADKPAEPEPPAEAAAAAEPANAKTAEPSSDDRHVKKVIKPLDTEPKQDLDTLLALEEAKEAVTAPPPAVTPIVVTDNPGKPLAAAPQNSVIEPVPTEDTASGEPAVPVQPAPTPPNDPANPNIAL